MSKDTKCNSTNLQLFLQKFNELTKHPEHFLSYQQKEVEKIKSFIKNLYDYINLENKQIITDILPKLIIDDLDEEQIWQQIEIKNDFILSKFVQTASKLLAIPDENLYIQFKSENHLEESDNNSADNDLEKTDKNSEDNEEISGSENNSNNNDSAQEYDENFDNDSEFNDIDKITKKNKIKIKPSIVDDKFFKLSELEAFLNSEDKKEMLKIQKPKQIKNSDHEDIDYFASDSSEDENNVNYTDFFEGDNEEQCKQNIVIDNDDNEVEDELEENLESTSNIENSCSNLKNTDSESDDNDNNSEDDDNNFDDNDDEKKTKSSYEKRQERLRQRIDEYEEKALGEKPWQLKGEISATSRPHNSLLEDILEYDSSTRPPPIITEEFNQTIEDIIRQRIKDKAWDDVVRIEKPVTTPQELRKKLILNPEKSKESLAQIYEKDYQKEIEKLSPTDETEKENPLHKEIKQMMSLLFKKLDALSNFHFTPKPVAPEPKIITNTPVINMEEVAPVSMSDAKLLAPEEIKGRSKGNILGESERTKTDKARERRHKKLRQKAIFKAKEINDLKTQNSKPSLNGKNNKNDKLLKDVIKSRNVSKVSASNDGNTFKSSKSFFSELQDKTATKEIKRKPIRKENKHELSAKKLKL